jgi:hypothetical protein
MSNQRLSLEQLAEQAEERITDFELVRDTVLRYLERDDNELGLEPFQAGTGTVHCLGSYITSLGEIRRDTLDMDAQGMLHRGRVYPQMEVTADLVGLWPKSQEAALYRVRSSFAPGPEQAEAPFQEAALEAIGDAYGYAEKRYHRSTETRTPSGIIMTSDYTGGTPILATPNTRITTEQYAVNELDDEIGVRVTLSGPAQIALPGEHLVKITPTKVLLSSRAEGKLDIDLPEGHPDASKTLRIKGGTQPEANSEGFLARPGYRNDDAEYNNPHIKTTEALRLATSEIKWRDDTPTVMEKLRAQLLAACVIDPAASLQMITDLARDAISQQLRTSSIEARAIGALSVTRRLKEMADDRSDRRQRVHPGFINQFAR